MLRAWDIEDKKKSQKPNENNDIQPKKVEY